VSFPRVYQAWATPPYGTREWVALDILAYLLADGDSSRLQRALIREGRLAQEVDTYLYPTTVCGVIGVVATARKGVAPETLEAALRRVLDDVATARKGVAPETLEEAIRRVLDDVATNGVTDDEVLGAVRRVRRDQVGELATVEERAESLAYAATVLGEPEALERVFELYGEVTADEVRRAAAAWLDAERGATLAVVPRPGSAAADEGEEDGDDEDLDEGEDEEAGDE